MLPQAVSLEVRLLLVVGGVGGWGSGVAIVEGICLALLSSSFGELAAHSACFVFFVVSFFKHLSSDVVEGVAYWLVGMTKRRSPVPTCGTHPH